MAEIYNPESLRVLAFFRAKRGHAAELQRIFLSLVEPTQSEPGNIPYILHVHESDRRYLVFNGIWMNRKAFEEHPLRHHPVGGKSALRGGPEKGFEEHLQKPYILSLLGRIEHLMEEPPRIEVYRAVQG